MGGLVCRRWQQFHCPQKLPRIQASDWLAPQEANVNNNNSLVAPIRGLLFGGKIGGKGNCLSVLHQTSNHAQLVLSKSRLVLFSKASSPTTSKFWKSRGSNGRSWDPYWADGRESRSGVTSSSPNVGLLHLTEDGRRFTDLKSIIWHKIEENPRLEVSQKTHSLLIQYVIFIMTGS